jgi:hypothetical protein
VARVDPAMNPETGRLSIRRVSVEAGCDGTQVSRATREAIAGLATFLAAGAIDYDGDMPSRWLRPLNA